MRWRWLECQLHVCQDTMFSHIVQAMSQAPRAVLGLVLSKGGPEADGRLVVEAVAADSCNMFGVC